MFVWVDLGLVLALMRRRLGNVSGFLLLIITPDDAEITIMDPSCLIFHPNYYTHKILKHSHHFYLTLRI